MSYIYTLPCLLTSTTLSFTADRKIPRINIAYSAPYTISLTRSYQNIDVSKLTTEGNWYFGEVYKALNQVAQTFEYYKFLRCNLYHFLKIPIFVG